MGIKEEDLDYIGYVYENLPVKSVLELLEISSMVKESLPNIESPVLLIHSLNDELVKPESSQYVFENIKSEEKDILWIDSSKHSIIKYSVNNKENVDIVFKAIHEFLEKH